MEHNGLRCRWVSTGVEIETGGRVENIRLQFPVKIHKKAGAWEIKSAHNIITIDTFPWIRIKWRKVTAPFPKNIIKEPSI